MPSKKDRACGRHWTQPECHPPPLSFEKLPGDSPWGGARPCSPPAAPEAAAEEPPLCPPAARSRPRQLLSREVYTLSGSTVVCEGCSAGTCGLLSSTIRRAEEEDACLHRLCSASWKAAASASCRPFPLPADLPWFDHQTFKLPRRVGDESGRGRVVSTSCCGQRC